MSSGSQDEGIVSISDLRRGGGYVGVASVVLNVLALALPLALLQVYDRIIPNSSIGTLLLLLAGVAGAIFLESTLRVARAEIISWIGVQYEHKSACNSFTRIMNTPADELERVGAGELIERLGGLPTVREVFAENWTLVVCDLPFVLLFLGGIAYLAGWLVLAPTLVLAAFIGFTLAGKAKAEKAIADFNQVRDRRQNFSIEVIQGVHSVKALAMEAQMIQRYARLQAAVAQNSHRVVSVNAESMGIAGIFSQLLTLSVVVFGGLMVVDNALTVGGLSACTLLAGRALQPIQKAVGLYTRWRQAVMMRDRFETIFALPQECQPASPVTSPLVGKVELKDVHFRPVPDEDPIFAGLELTVEPGERIAIGGENGAGKSTLLRLIHGSIAPHQGSVLLDGVPVGEYDRDHLLRHDGVALIPQRGELLRGTILENLTMFRAERRKEALRLAGLLGLDDVIYRLANGYHTRVGDGGSDILPRGVIQRVAVVRSLVSRPRVLLFDEANAAMDGPGDERLRNYFETLSRDVTLIMITLRPSLQRLADRMYRIEKGVLVPAVAAAPQPVAAAPAEQAPVAETPAARPPIAVVPAPKPAPAPRAVLAARAAAAPAAGRAPASSLVPAPGFVAVSESGPAADVAPAEGVVPAAGFVKVSA
ncbi:peptidase domain-containing ABC transporter [Magnetospirillum sp. UT-4]|uniref:peptidase domain-containing ABC transporter n=1 Tax=Magnetospirillum sp. UT-4 TaxID=2681467 RepID=UPI00137EF92F|nr:ABC transporter transmembrane domain-containing protein [Magnetospirillum sp. UT-4]CAA7615054.1 ABC transporter protein [Magnetospirillum sp. UT-4]